MEMIRILIIIILFSLQSAYGQAVDLYLHEVQIRTDFKYLDPDNDESKGQFMIDKDGTGQVIWGKGIDTLKVRGDSLVMIYGNYADSSIVAIGGSLGAGSGLTENAGNIDLGGLLTGTGRFKIYDTITGFYFMHDTLTMTDLGGLKADFFGLTSDTIGSGLVVNGILNGENFGTGLITANGQTYPGGLAGSLRDLNKKETNLVSDSLMNISSLRLAITATGEGGFSSLGNLNLNATDTMKQNGTVLEVNGDIGGTDEYFGTDNLGNVGMHPIGGGFTDTLNIGGVTTLTQDSTSLPYATSDFSFGSPSLDDDGNPDHDARMFFDKSNGSFRAGSVNSTQWDTRGDESVAFGVGNTSTGLQSISWGANCTASGARSTAFGISSTASQNYSFAGANSTASGTYSFAYSDGGVASGYHSFAMGENNTSSGNYAVGLGVDILSRSWKEVAFGSAPTDYTPSSGTNWQTSDRIFNVGNGASSGARSDAFTILKNGNTGIGIDNFEANDGGQLLQVNGSFRVMQIDSLTFGDDTLTTANHYLIKVNSNAGTNDTIFLPDLAAGDEGAEFTVIDGTYNASVNPFVLATVGAENIDNAATKLINTDGDHVSVFWWNDNYYIKEE